MKVHGDDVLQVLVHDPHLRGVRRHVAYVVLVGEHEPGLNVRGALAGLAVGLPHVEPRVALAGVRALVVDALLRAHAWNQVQYLGVLEVTSTLTSTDHGIMA